MPNHALNRTRRYVALLGHIGGGAPVSVSRSAAEAEGD